MSDGVRDDLPPPSRCSAAAVRARRTQKWTRTPASGRSTPVDRSSSSSRNCTSAPLPACGDADAMRRDLTRTRNQFAVDVDRLAGRLGPSRGRAALPGLVVAVGALVLVAAVRRRRRDAADR